MIYKLKSVSTLEVTTEDNVTRFLGVHINQRDDGTIQLLWTVLTDRIVKALDLGDQKPRNTPAACGTLSSDIDKIWEQGIHNYRSKIGMMIHLLGHSGPDINFVVTQCARWSHCLKKSYLKVLEELVYTWKEWEIKAWFSTPKQHNF